MNHLERTKNIEAKLMMLRSGSAIFLGRAARQKLPFCCNHELDLETILHTDISAVHVEMDGVDTTLFEVVCPRCGQPIPPVAARADSGDDSASNKSFYKRKRNPL